MLEVKDAGQYTYLRLKTTGGETWAAVQRSNVQKGAQVTIDNVMLMKDFESRALNRKFDRIVLGTLVSHTRRVTCRGDDGRQSAYDGAAHGHARRQGRQGDGSGCAYGRGNRGEAQ